MPKNDGGPAYPTTMEYNEALAKWQSVTDSDGMSLRDYAAVHYTAAWIVSLGRGLNLSEETIAELAHDKGQIQADAMIAARERDDD